MANAEGLSIWWKLAIVLSFPVALAAPIWINVKASPDSLGAFIGIMAVLGGCAFTTVGVLLLSRGSLISGAFWIALGLSFTGFSLMNAVGNSASLSDEMRGNRQQKIDAAAKNGAEKRQLTEDRARHLETSKGDTPEMIEADISSAKAKGGKEWKSSKQCTDVTADESRKLCDQIAKLGKKKAAAEEIIKIDARLADLKKEADANGPAPESADPANERIKFALAEMGYTPSVALIAQSRDWYRAIIVELLPDFLPAVVMLLARLSLSPLPSRPGLVSAVKMRMEARAEAKAAKAAAQEEARKREEEEAERRQAEAEARARAKAEALSAERERLERERAEAEAKAKAEAKREKAKTRVKGDPKTVKAWVDSPSTVRSPNHVLDTADAYPDYARYCEAHGVARVSKGCAFTGELRKLGFKVPDKGNKRGSEIVGLALTGGLRVVSSAAR